MESDACWSSGSASERDELEKLVYAQLRKMAARIMRSERENHTLQATVLADDAFMDLVHADSNWQNRAHFFAMSARLMRQILVDYARAHGSVRRGAGAQYLSLDEVAVVSHVLPGK